MGWGTFLHGLRQLATTDDRVKLVSTLRGARGKGSGTRSGAWLFRKTLMRAATGCSFMLRVRPFPVVGQILSLIQYSKAFFGLRPDVVHAAGHLFGGVPALFLPAVPLVLTLDSTDLQIRRMGLNDGRDIKGSRFERWLLCRAAEVHCTSAWAQRSVISDFGVPEDRVFVTPYFLKGPEREPVLCAINDRSEQQSIHVAFIANDLARKGAPLLYDVLENWTGPSIVVHIFSNDRALGKFNPPHCTVHGGVDNATLMRKFMPRMDLLILPSRFDQSPMVVCEAFAWGVPALVSSVGALAEMVTHDYDGVVLAQTDADALCGALTSLASDRERLVRLSYNARRTFEQRHDSLVSGKAFLQRLVRLTKSGVP